MKTKPSPEQVAVSTVTGMPVSQSKFFTKCMPCAQP